MSEVKLIEGDSYAVLRKLKEAGNLFGSCCTDPPYGLTSIVERFGKSESKAAKFGTDGAFGRYSAGFMGQTWDATGVERDAGFWKLVYDVLLPGAYIVAFSSARTYHHMASAIEASGFISHPMIGWVYAQGMAKPHDALVPGREGWKHGAQVRKPAIEPIYVGQKPFSEKTARPNILKHGVGAVNIGGIMIPSDAGDPRYPANLITDGSAEVAELFPISAGQRGASTIAERSNAIYQKMSNNSSSMQPRKDAGSAIRFFEQYAFACDECQDRGFIVVGQSYGSPDGEPECCPVCEGASSHVPFDGTPLIYHQKANRIDRDGSTHATVKPIGLMQSLVRHVTPPGQTVLDPFAGTGTTGIAALREGVDAILIEAQPLYAQDIRRRLLTLTGAGEDYLDLLGVDR